MKIEFVTNIAYWNFLRINLPVLFKIDRKTIVKIYLYLIMIIFRISKMIQKKEYLNKKTFLN